MADVGSELQSEDKLGVIKTIYLFLLDNEFKNVAKLLKIECHSREQFFENVAAKSILLKRGTVLNSNFNKNKFDVHNENSAKSKDLKSGNNPQIFYVCDNENLEDQNPREKKSEMSRIPSPHKASSSRLESSLKQKANSNIYLDEKNEELVKLKSKFSDLHGEHQKLLAVTSELTNTLQMNIIGQSQNIYYALEQCKNIYPTLFANNANVSSLRLNQTAEHSKQIRVESGGRHGHDGRSQNSSSNNPVCYVHEKRRNFDGANSDDKLESNHSHYSLRNQIKKGSNDIDDSNVNLTHRHAELRHRSNSSERRSHSAHDDPTKKHGNYNVRSHTSEERYGTQKENHSGEKQNKNNLHIGHRQVHSSEAHGYTDKDGGGECSYKNDDCSDSNRTVEDKRLRSVLKNSSRFEEEKNAIIDHVIMTQSSRTNSPRSGRTHCTNHSQNSPRFSEKSSILKKERHLEAAHFINDFNHNDKTYPNQYVTHFVEIEPLNLTDPNSALDSIPEIKHPLTPDTVRHVLDLVFNRIFEIESTKPNSYTRVIQSAPLNREEVKQVVDNVFEEMISKGQVGLPNLASGEGETLKSAILSSRSENDKIFDLNFEKVKNDLINGDIDRKVRLLQALRWRITKNDSSDRDRVMESYILNDILDLYSGVCMPERLLNDVSDVRVQESACRLINTIASLRQGRDYLTSEDRLLKRILLKKIKDLRSVSSAVIRNMLLASVQKLSIRKQCRNQMVYEGLLEVLVDYLDDFYEKLSRYSLEYSCALVMNLCLVEEAKERAKHTPKKIVGLIKKLLESEVNCCLPYVNGIMFSLFEKEDIVNEAIEQNLDKLLIRIIRTTTNESMRKQLDFIVQSRLFGKGDPMTTDNEDDGREEVDLLEIELDEDDFITQMTSGEKLLEEYRVNFWVNPMKPYPDSGRTFSEETKQFHHKPSSERGIFEATTPRKYLPPQGLINNYISRKNVANLNGKISERGKMERWYGATPLCYMENCQKMLQGGQGTCSCTKCVPRQSRYSCGCYDAIKKELSEIESKEFDSKSRW